CQGHRRLEHRRRFVARGTETDGPALGLRRVRWNLRRPGAHLGVHRLERHAGSCRRHAGDLCVLPPSGAGTRTSLRGAGRSREIPAVDRAYDHRGARRVLRFVPAGVCQRSETPGLLGLAGLDGAFRHREPRAGRTGVAQRDGTDRCRAPGSAVSLPLRRRSHARVRNETGSERVGGNLLGRDGEGRRRHVLGSVRPVECRPLALRQRAGEQLLPCVELYAGLSASQPQAGREMSLSMRFLTTFALAVVTMAAPALAQPKYPFQDPALDPEKRIDNALSLLTLDEKIAGLGMSGVESSRLGIRKMAIGEALSGVVLGGPMSTLLDAFPGASPELKMQPTPTTQFSQGVGFGRTWDPALVRKAGDVIGSEARYIFENGKNSKAFLVLLTPNADLARDPRWGRTQESYGEDPMLNGTLATALIQGIQGGDPKHWQAASLVKHFLANSNEEGRYGSTSDFDVRLLREYYSMPFRMAFVEGGARSFMASYNAWNKVPMTVNPILRDIAMKEWGVDGIVCTDAGSLGNLVGQHKY